MLVLPSMTNAERGRLPLPEGIRPRKQQDSDEGIKRTRSISVASRYLVVVYEPKWKAQGDVAAREPVTLVTSTLIGCGSHASGAQLPPGRDSGKLASTNNLTTTAYK